MVPPCFPPDPVYKWLPLKISGGPSQGYPPAFNSPVAIHTPGWREALHVRVPVKRFVKFGLHFSILLSVIRVNLVSLWLLLSL